MIEDYRTVDGQEAKVVASRRHPSFSKRIILLRNRGVLIQMIVNEWNISTNNND